MAALPVTFRALGSKTGLRRALAAFLIFTVVHWSVWIAVILWAFGKGGAQLAAIASIAQLIPAAFLAPMLASLGDRMPRNHALVLVYSLGECPVCPRLVRTRQGLLDQLHGEIMRETVRLWKLANQRPMQKKLLASHKF